MKKCKTGQKGQSLVEMIVVIGMVVLMTTGIVAGTTMSLSRTTTSQTRTEALSFAQAGVELARSKRDQGWNAFVALGSVAGKTYCVGSSGDFGLPQASCTTANIGVYTRAVTLTLQTVNGTQVMKVASLVFWQDASPSHQVQLITYLTQWR